MDRAPNKHEVAAMWLYGKEYSRQSLGIIEFYRTLTDWQRTHCEQLVRDVIEAPNAESER